MSCYTSVCEDYVRNVGFVLTLVVDVSHCVNNLVEQWNYLLVTPIKPLVVIQESRQHHGLALNLPTPQGYIPFRFIANANLKLIRTLVH